MQLTLYLFAKNYYPLQTLDLGEYSSDFRIRLSEGETTQVFLADSSAAPKWLSELSAVASTPPPMLFASSVKGLFFIRVRRHWMAASFGHSWQMLSNCEIVRDFGTRTVLNLADEKSLRSIRRSRVADAGMQAIEVIPDADSISRFGMDIEQDLLNGVKAKASASCELGNTLNGTESLKIEVDLESKSIRSVCEEAFRIYHRRSYAKSFAWFDNIHAETSPSLIERLNLKLARAVSLGVKSFTMCTPSLLAWDEYDTISYAPQRSRTARVSQELDVRQWRKSLGPIRISVKTLMEKKIYAYKSDTPQVVSSWPVIRCINAQISLDKNTFFLSSGSWFRVEQNYINKVNVAISKIAVEKYTPPKQIINKSLKLEHEGEYNLRIGTSFASRYYLMDKNLVTIIGHSTVEVCDLLRRDGTMICVKPWGGKSSSLSHLFQQAIVSMKLLSGSNQYAADVEAKISDIGFHKSWQKARDEPKVVLAILRGIPKESLPFFAKVSLANCERTLREMRCRVSYVVIPKS